MIVVFDDHSCEILLPPCAEIPVRIVVGVFMYQPVVAEFIHDIQTQPVTGIQQRLGGRVMGGTYRVETGLLEQTDTAQLGILKRAGTQNAIVVVDAGATEQRFLAVYKKSSGAPAKGTESKPGVRLIHHLTIFQQFRSASVQLGMFRVPKPRLGNGNVRRRSAFLDRSFGLRHHLFTIQNRDSDRITAGDRNLHMGRIVSGGGDEQSIRADMTLIPQEEVYAAINSAAGIPTGIGYRRVVRNHFDFIFFAILQLWVQHHKEVGIPVPLFSHKRIVHEHLRVLINCLKFQHSGLCPPRFRHKKPFDVDIGPAGKVSARSRCCRILRAFLVQHGIVGKRDRLHRRFLSHGAK